jgi:hypothetical protein
MGCSSGSFRQQQLYDLNTDSIEFLPVCNLELEPKMEEIKLLDSSTHFNQKKPLHIKKVVIPRSHFINGFTLYYEIEEKEVVVEMKGSSFSFNADILALDSYDHIEYIEASYSNLGIHSIELRTARGKKLLSVGQSGIAKDKRSIDLHDHGKGIVGVRCGLKDCLISLCIYAALRIDIATKEELAQY